MGFLRPGALVLSAARRDAQARQPMPDLANGTGMASIFADPTILESFAPDPVSSWWLTQEIDRHRAMGVAAVAKGRSLIAGSIGRFPLITMQGAAALVPQPAQIRQPEVGRPRYTTMSWTVDALIFYGRAYWRIIERNATDNRPSRFEWVPEWNAETDALGNLISAWGAPVAIGDSIRIDGPHEGILNFARGVIREAIAIDKAASHASDNPVPSIELHQTGGDPLTQTQIAELVAGWQRARQGSGVGYTNQSIELIPHGQPTEQLLIDGRNVTALNVARAMGLPAWAVDATVTGSSLNYSNTPSRSRELIDYTLTPYMAAIESRLSLDDVLPAGQWVRFDTTDLLRGDFASRMDAYAVAIAAGVYTAEECRAMEQGSAVEEGSIHA